MKFLTWDSLFGPITGKRNKNRTLKNAEWTELDEDTHFNGYEYAKSSKYKVFETTNFGWVVFSRSSKTPNGDTPGRFIHNY